jgi:uncharacterized membrane protein YedE/YeeE
MLKSWLLPLLLVLGVLGACVAYGIAMSILVATPVDRAAFGEMFGGLGAAFAGLAFGGLVYSLRQAQRDIAEQQESTAQIRAQLARAAQLNGLDSLAAVYLNVNTWAGQTGHTQALTRSNEFLKSVVTEVEVLCDRTDHYYI